MKTSRIKAIFSRFASEYDEHMLLTNHVKVQHEILDNFLNFLNGKVLDIATGTGTVAKYIKNKTTCDVHAIDNSKEMIQKAKFGLGIKYKVADVHKIPYEDRSFDVVVISYGFYWFENLRKVINEVKRVLKSRGLFIVMEEEFKQGKVPEPRFSEKGGYLKELAELENYIGVDKLKDEIKKTGFELIKEIKIPVDDVHYTIGMVYRYSD